MTFESLTAVLRRVTLTTAIAVLPLGAVQAAGGATSGEAKDVEATVKVCATCHGADGKTPLQPAYPKIAGQYKDYLVQSLKDYRSGARKNPIMTGQAAALSDADIMNLADYYANLPGVYTLNGRR